MKALLRHESGIEKMYKIAGISWTVFFFTWIALLVRAQYKEAIIFIIVSVVATGLSTFTFGATSIVTLAIWIYYFLKANDMRYNNLKENGWTLAN